MTITEEQLVHELGLLRHGGAEAVILFVDRARSLFHKGGAEHLSNWVAVAAPALPEADRNAAMTLLLRAIFGDYDLTLDFDDEQVTLQ